MGGRGTYGDWDGKKQREKPHIHHKSYITYKYIKNTPPPQHTYKTGKEKKHVASP